jgi:hypothetical protein
MLPYEPSSNRRAEAVLVGAVDDVEAGILRLDLLQDSTCPVLRIVVDEQHVALGLRREDRLD